MTTDKRIVIAWCGLPIYGATAIKAAFERFGRTFPVLQTPAVVPIRGVEDILGLQPTLVDPTKPVTWAQLGLEVPEVLVFTGWSRPAFNALAREVKQAGGLTISMVDTQWVGNLRQQIGRLVFRLKYRSFIDVMWVPGVSGRQVARKFGLPERCAYEGLYASSPEIFTDGPPLSQRARRFLYVGNLAPYKGVDHLARAYEKYRHDGGTWELHVYGQGPMKSSLEGIEGVSVHPFEPSPSIAAHMRNSPFFVIASRHDAWGLVVHEAALSGCGILCTDRVGAHQDLLEDGKNGYVVPVGDTDALVRAMTHAAALSEPELDATQALSREKARQFSPARWAETLEQIISEHCK